MATSIPTYAEQKPNQPRFEGEPVKLEDILGKEIVVKDFKILDSKFEDGPAKYLCIQAELDSKLVIVNTGSEVLTKLIQEVRLPFKGKIVRPAGKRYYKFE